MSSGATGRRSERHVEADELGLEATRECAEGRVHEEDLAFGSHHRGRVRDSGQDALHGPEPLSFRPFLERLGTTRRRERSVEDARGRPEEGDVHEAEGCALAHGVEVEIAAVARDELAEERALGLPGEVGARGFHERIAVDLLDEDGAGARRGGTQLGVPDDLDGPPDDAGTEARPFDRGRGRPRLPAVERHARGVQRDREGAERVLDEAGRAFGDLLPEVEEARELNARKKDRGGRVVRSFAEGRGCAAPGTACDRLEGRRPVRRPLLLENEHRRRDAGRSAREERRPVRDRAWRHDEDDFGLSGGEKRGRFVDRARDEHVAPRPLERGAHGLRNPAPRAEEEEWPHQGPLVETVRAREGRVKATARISR